MAHRVPPLTLALTGALAAVLLPLSPPTGAFGAWGWLVAAFLLAISAMGMLRLRAIGPRPSGQLLLIGYLGIGQLAMFEWLSGGDPSPYRNLILVWIVYTAMLQVTRRLVVFLVVVAAALKLSLVLSGLDPLVFGEDAALLLVGVVLALGAARVVEAVSIARSSEAYLAAIVASSDDAVMAATPDGLISSWNAGAEKLFGYSAEEVIGKPTAVLIPPSRAEEIRMSREVMAGNGVSQFDTERVTKDGQVIDVSLTLSPLRGDDGAIVGASAIARDITSRKRAERAQEESERRTRLILDTAHEAFISMDAQGLIIDWNPQAEATFGWTRSEAVGRKLGDTIVPPRYREQHDEGFRRFLATGEGPLIERRIEIEAQHREGHEFPVELTISPLRVGGEYVFNSFLRDISERKRAEAALRAAEERFGSAFSLAPIGMALVDLEGRFMQANRAMSEITGYTEDELVVRTFRDITHPDDVELDVDHVRRLLAGEIPSFGIEKRYCRPGGDSLWAMVNVSLVRDEEGEPLHFLRQVQDISERKRNEEGLRRYADDLKALTLEDPLTGLFNVRELGAVVEREVSRVERHGGALSVMTLVLDGFDGLTRDRGHFEGDRVLLAVAAVLKDACRASDLAFRGRGAQFALVLPETTREECAPMVERATAKVAALEMGVSLRVGVAEWPGNGVTGAALLGRAEVAMHSEHQAEPASAEVVSSQAPPAETTVEAGDTEDAGPDIVERILSVARDQLGMDLAYVAELTDGEQVFRSLEGDADSFGLAVGDSIPLEGTYCQRMVTGVIPNVIADAQNDERVNSLDVTQGAGVGAYIGVPLKLSDGRLYGTLCCASHSADASLGKREVGFLQVLAEMLADQLERAELQLENQRLETQTTGMRALLAALEARDNYTGKHSQSVVELAGLVARELAFTPTDVAEVEQVALLHDIGKVGVPDAVLQKQGKLDEREWEIMRHHPVIGERIVASIDGLTHLGRAVRAEHERWDGAGYPDGLAGEEIPIASRIGFACDAYHAMTSDRPYRRAMPEADALDELQRNAGSQFDPGVIDALVRVLEKRSGDAVLLLEDPTASGFAAQGSMSPSNTANVAP